MQVLDCLITKFDIIDYLDDVYEEDMEYCRKVNDQYQLLDMWNSANYFYSINLEVVMANNTIVITQSQMWLMINGFGKVNERIDLKDRNLLFTYSTIPLNLGENDEQV